MSALLLAEVSVPMRTPPRRCSACGVVLIRAFQERWRQFQQRQTCSEPCELLYNGIYEGLSDSRWRSMFPGAAYRTWDEVPHRCRCGGAWVLVESGVCCLLCARDAVVAAALIRRLLLAFRGIVLLPSTDT